MTNYRNSKLVERYEDVVFELETALANPALNAHQIKTGHRFIVNNSGETTPFDWYNSRFNVDFKVTRLDDTPLEAVDNVARFGIVNSTSSLIKKIDD